MDTGKILMGMAMLLITIGLLVHPAGAAETGGISTLGQGNVIGYTGPAPVCSDIPCITGTGSHRPRHAPVRTIDHATYIASVNPRISHTSYMMDVLRGG